MALILEKKPERALSALLGWLATLINVAARVSTSSPSKFIKIQSLPRRDDT